MKVWDWPIYIKIAEIADAGALLMHWSYVSLALTHWGRATHICVSKLTVIGSDNGLMPGPRQAMIWTNTEILLIEPLGTNFSENLIGIQTFSFKKMHLKMLSAKWRLFRLGLNELSHRYRFSDFILLAPDLQMSYKILTTVRGYQVSIPSNSHQVECPFLPH